MRFLVLFIFRTIYLQVDKEGNMAVEDIQENAVGKNVSTKSVGSFYRNDLTDHYKYEHGAY